MEARNLSLTLEASSQIVSPPIGSAVRGTEALELFRAEWDRHRGGLLVEGLAALDRLPLATRRRNNLQALYRVLMNLPSEDVRYNKEHGFCLYPGGYGRLKAANIKGDRKIVKQRLNDLVAAGLIYRTRLDNPQDRFSQLVIPLPTLTPPVLSVDWQAGRVRFKERPKRIRKKVEKPPHYRNKKTVGRLLNFLGYGTLIVVQVEPGLKAKEIAEWRGVSVNTVWADLRMALSLNLVRREKACYFPCEGAFTLYHDQMTEMDVSVEARFAAMTSLFKSEDFYIRSLLACDLSKQQRSNRTYRAKAAREKLDRLHSGEPLSIIFGYRS